MEFTKTMSVLKSRKLPLETEESCQRALASAFKEENLMYAKEYRFDSKNRIDFFGDGIGIEVKIKGNAQAILKQCERYCAFDELKVLILVTNRAMGFPAFINDKPCYVVSLGKSWL